MKKPFILITNDDGIKAKGLKELYSAINDIADVFIIAPNKVRSGAGHSVSIWQNIEIKKTKFYKKLAYSVKGTPVDCIKIAMFNLLRKKPLLVISGINHGPNFGKFIHYSGTVGAATEAALLGIPSLAISYDDFDNKADFTNAKAVIKILLKNILNKKIKLEKHLLLNINIPKGKIQGVKILPKSLLKYDEEYKKIKYKNKIYYFWNVKETKNYKNIKSSDEVALKNGFVTITPLKFDTTDYKLIKKLKKLRLEKIIGSELNQTLL